MNMDEKLYEEMESYLHERMNETERSAFEAKIAVDPILKKEIEQFQFIKTYYNKDLVDFKRSLQEVELRYFKKKELIEQENLTEIKEADKKIFKFWNKKARWIAIAASIVLVAGIFYFTSEKGDVVQLAMEDSLNGYNPGLSTVRRESRNGVDTIFYYGNYLDFIAHAIPKLKENLTVPERKTLNIDICKSYIQLKQPNNAILFYQSLPDTDKEDCYLQYQAALANIIVNDVTNAISLFKEVIEKDCFPADDSSKVWLERID